MPRPKGHKSEHGYSTAAKFEGGMGYYEIAAEMNKRGFKMNHSAARHILVNALDKIAHDVCAAYGVNADDETRKRISKDPRFQEGIYDMLKNGR